MLVLPIVQKETEQSNEPFIFHDSLLFLRRHEFHFGNFRRLVQFEKREHLSIEEGVSFGVHEVEPVLIDEHRLRAQPFAPAIFAGVCLKFLLHLAGVKSGFHDGFPL